LSNRGVATTSSHNFSRAREPFPEEMQSVTNYMIDISAE
jgi:hypothetical protein